MFVLAHERDRPERQLTYVLLVGFTGRPIGGEAGISSTRQQLAPSQGDQLAISHAAQILDVDGHHHCGASRTGAVASHHRRDTAISSSSEGRPVARYLSVPNWRQIMCVPRARRNNRWPIFTELLGLEKAGYPRQLFRT